MDTLSHAGWGWVSLAGRGRRLAWWGFVAGAAPDLLYFVPMMLRRFADVGWAAFSDRPQGDYWRAHGPPMPDYLVEAYHRYYLWTHSLVILALAVGVLWLFTRSRPAARAACWLAVPYGLHILMDLPTHERYLTRPLWPLSEWTMVGLAWSDPRIFLPQLALLIAAILWRLAARRRRGAAGVGAS